MRVEKRDMKAKLEVMKKDFKIRVKKEKRTEKKASEKENWNSNFKETASTAEGGECNIGETDKFVVWEKRRTIKNQITVSTRNPGWQSESSSI